MSKKKLLIADDSPINLEILCHLFDREYEILEAKNGEEAVQLIQNYKEEIKMVLLDLIMPVQDGFDVLDYMRFNRILSDIPVLVVTGTSDPNDMYKAFAYGATDVLVKPYDAEAILTKVNTITELYERRKVYSEGLAQKFFQQDCYLPYDQVTGLLDMHHFLDMADSFMQKLDDNLCKEYVYCYGNIRNFKYYNENYGKKFGDALLKGIADELKGKPGNVLCATFGADHIVILTNNPDFREEFKKYESRFNNKYSKYGMSLQAGVYRVRHISDSAYMACEYAKLACDSIHDSTEDFCEFGEELEKRIEIKEYILHHIDQAIVNEEIIVYYQPVTRAVTGTICSFEALSRWNDPKYGFFSPASFIPVLEDAGIIYKLDQYVLEKVCRYLAKRIKEGRPVVPVSVNLSRIDFFKFDTVEFIEKTREQYGIDRKYLVVEITESVAMSDREYIGARVEELRKLGYQVWMDDFGSGYSSLTVLQDFNFDEIKLDMAFLQQFNEKSKKVISTMVTMAKKMGISTLAEGVETKEHFDYLRMIGCDKIQGYYVSKPIPPCEIDSFMVSSERTMETHGQQFNYSHLSTIDFMSDRAMAIVEFNGETSQILYANEQFEKIWNSLGPDALEAQMENEKSHQTRFWKDYCKHLEQVKRDHLFHAIDYTFQNFTFRIKSRCISQYQDRYLCETEIENRGEVKLDIRDFIDVQEITNAMRAWSRACNMATIALDANGEYLTERVGFTDFCTKYTRGSKKGYCRCKYCDQHNYGVYLCHAGLTDFGFDIALENGQVVGRIIGGQILTHHVEDEKMLALADELHIDREAYLKAAYNVPIRDEESVKASAYLLKSIINGIVNIAYARKVQNTYIQELDNLSKRDSMTGLYDNKYCMNYVETMIFENRPFSMCIIDVDSFKQINDNYGHLFGDTVLKSLTRVLEEVVSENGMIGRYGGDEFIIIIPNEKEETMFAIASEIQKRVSQLTFEGVSGFHLSVSIGISSYPKNGITGEELYQSADLAMYASKNQGDGFVNVYDKNAVYSRVMTREILNRIPCVVVVYHRTKEGELVREYISEYAKYFTGKDDAHDADMKEIMSVVHPDDKERVLKKVSETVAAGVGMDEIYRVVHTKGKVFWVHHTANAINHPDGSCTFYAVYTEVLRNNLRNE